MTILMFTIYIAARYYIVSLLKQFVYVKEPERTVCKKGT
jgi:hypothetical protein